MSNLLSKLKRFFSEDIGAFILVVFATVSVILSYLMSLNPRLYSKHYHSNILKKTPS